MYSKDLQKIKEIEKKFGRSYIVYTSFKNAKYSKWLAVCCFFTAVSLVGFPVLNIFFDLQFYYSLGGILVLPLLLWIFLETFIMRVQKVLDKTKDFSGWNILNFSKNLETQIFAEKLVENNFSIVRIESISNWLKAYRTKIEIPFFESKLGFLLFGLIVAFIFDIIKLYIIPQNATPIFERKFLLLGLYFLILFTLFSETVFSFMKAGLFDEQRLLYKLDLFKFHLKNYPHIPVCWCYKNLTIRSNDMITAIVQFNLLEPISVEEAHKLFIGTAPKYSKIQGLIRKYYLLSKDGKTAGGVYLWKSQEDAEKLYTEDWKKFIQDKYGSNPTITYFDSPVIVDNLTKEILSII